MEVRSLTRNMPASAASVVLCHHRRRQSLSFTRPRLSVRTHSGMMCSVADLRLVPLMRLFALFFRRGFLAGTGWKKSYFFQVCSVAFDTEPC